MRLRKLRNTMKFEGKRVLVRIDANVPIKKGRVVDGPNGRIARSAVNINWLIQRGAKVIVLSHLGRPKGRRISAYSLKPVQRRLSELLGVKVKLTRSVIGLDVQKSVENMQNGDVLLLENLRFDRRERDNDREFARSLAELGDFYVNDAFANSHRAHASMDAITKELPSYAGPLLANEVTTLAKLDANVRHPFVLIVGGLKMKTKLPVIQRFEREVEHVLLGGALSTTFLVAQGYEVGKSVYEDSEVALAKKEMKTLGDRLILPFDVLVARSIRRDARMRVATPDSIHPKERIVDIGPKTAKRFREVVSEAKMIVWNGPLGYCEVDSFCGGTQTVARAVAKRTGKAVTIVGGGDTGPVLEELKLADKFTLMSTGGGAMLEFLANKPLPGVEALKVSD